MQISWICVVEYLQNIVTIVLHTPNTVSGTLTGSFFLFSSLSYIPHVCPQYKLHSDRNFIWHAII